MVLLPRQNVERLTLTERKKKISRKPNKPIIRIDRSGKIKTATLESMVLAGLDSWRSSKELSMDPLFENYPYLSGWRCLSVRLQR